MYGKMSLMKKTNYAELVELLCGIRPIMWKRPNYAQIYVHTKSHNSTIPTFVALMLNR